MVKICCVHISLIVHTLLTLLYYTYKVKIINLKFFLGNFLENDTDTYKREKMIWSDAAASDSKTSFSHNLRNCCHVVIVSYEGVQIHFKLLHSFYCFTN